MWEVSKSKFGHCDVIPINDSIEHIYGGGCPCRPRNEDGIWIHNSADGREILERARASVSGN